MKSALSILIVLLSLCSDIILPGSRAESDSVFLINNAASMSQQQLSEQVLRLHVLANSDSAADQAIKLKVRDAVVARFTSDLTEMNGIDGAVEYAREHKDEIIQTADGVLADNGFDYSARIEIVTSDFPEKKYGDMVFPAGKYLAVRIILGEGKGQNWWCVLYPPLCFLNIMTEENSEDTTEKTDEEIKIKWKFAEWLHLSDD